MKKCSKCKIEKEFSEFCKSKNRPDGLHYYCKLCVKKDKIQPTKEYYAEYRKKNKEKIKESHSKYKKTEKGKITNSRQYKKYRLKNKDKINLRSKLRRKNNPLEKVIIGLRNRLRKFIKSNKQIKNGTMIEILGCSKEFFKTYLENQFNSEMNWNNYGTYWHIDHIIPISNGKNIEELNKLSHYTNLRPLEAKENMRKGNKIE